MKYQKSTQKKRWVYAGLTLIAMSTCILLLGYFFSYIQSGAEQTNTYEAGHSLLAHHQPTILWEEDDPNIGGEINKYIREEITKSYSDAWGILNLSMKNIRDLGMRENFTERKTKDIAKSLTRSSPIKREDLSHKLKLHFISLDKQVVSFTDLEMISEITIPKSTVTYLDTSQYSVVMTLSEGKWRINKLLRAKNN